MGVSAEVRRARVERYLELVGDVPSWTDRVMELFAPNPTIEDPVGAGPKRGRDEVRAFYAAFDNIKGISCELREFHTSGDCSAAFAFDVVTSSAALDGGFDLGVDLTPGAKVRTSCIEVMTFDDDGLIVDMKAFWSPADDVAIES